MNEVELVIDALMADKHVWTCYLSMYINAICIKYKSDSKFLESCLLCCLRKEGTGKLKKRVTEI